MSQVTTIATCDQSYFQPKIGIIWSYKFITSCPRYSWNILKLISCGLFLIINSSCPIPDSMSPNFLWQDNFPKCVKNLSKMLPKNIQIPTKISNHPTPKSVHKVANFFIKTDQIWKVHINPNVRRKKRIIQEGYRQLNLHAVRAPALCPCPTQSSLPNLPCRSHIHKSLRLLNDGKKYNTCQGNGSSLLNSRHGLPHGVQSCGRQLPQVAVSDSLMTQFCVKSSLCSLFHY